MAIVAVTVRSASTLASRSLSSRVPGTGRARSRSNVGLEAHLRVEVVEDSDWKEQIVGGLKKRVTNSEPLGALRTTEDVPCEGRSRGRLVWPRIARTPPREVTVDTIRVGQAETVAHSAPVKLTVGLARQCVEDAGAPGAPGRRV